MTIRGEGMLVEPETLSLERLRRNLATDEIGQHVYLFGPIRSANGILRRLAQAGAGAGTVVLTEEQTAHPMSSPSSPLQRPSVYVAVLLRPALAPREVPVFAFITSLALSEAIWFEGLGAMIKWPNDVLIQGARVARTTVEYASVGDRVSWVILGVAVNVSGGDGRLVDDAGDGLREGSLAEAARRDVDRNAFVAGFLTMLEKWSRIYEQRGAETVLAAWRARDALRGRRIEVCCDRQRWPARVADVDADGCLVVVDATGRRQRLTAGAIRLVRSAA